MATTAIATLQPVWDCRWSQPGHRLTGVSDALQPETEWVCVRDGNRRNIGPHECATCPHWEWDVATRTNAGTSTMVVAYAPIFYSFARGLVGWELQPQVAYLMAMQVGMALLAGNGISVAVTAGYRRRLQQRLREKLQRFAREQQADVLLPLRATPTNDTRKIVEPLLRELRADSTEVSPAAVPVIHSRR